MQSFKDKINQDQLPQHVAIIMDGNGRWAKSRGEKRTFGHKHAIKAVREAVNACNEIHIPYLTLYTFSSENWNRPEDEVDTLMSLISETIILEAEEIFSKGLRMHIIGDVEKLPADVRASMQHLVDITIQSMSLDGDKIDIVQCYGDIRSSRDSNYTIGSI